MKYTIWFCLLGGVAIVGAGMSTFFGQARRREWAYKRAIDAWRTHPSHDDKAAALSPLTTGSRFSGPAWYLLGCLYLRQGRTREAARSFGMAHHQNCQLLTAALLTFACLKTQEGQDCDLVEQIVATWHEMKRPPLLQSAEDRRILTCVAETEGEPPSASPLARIIWLVASPTNKARLMSLIGSDDPRWSALRS